MNDSPNPKPKTVIRVYETFPRVRNPLAKHQLTLDQAKKYASPRPLRRPDPRTT